MEGLDGTFNMIDDILVYGGTKKQHDQRLLQVVLRLFQAGVTLNREKCSFGVFQVSFLGVVA